MRSRLHKVFGKSRSQRKRSAHNQSRRRRPTIETLEDRCLLAASPPLLDTIEGFNIDQNAFNTGNSIVHPPDPYGAAGPNHVVNIGNMSIQWFGKDGTPQMLTSLKNFFAPLRPQTALFDPKVIYDQYEGRFVALALEMMDTANGDPVDLSRIMLAVSDDSDPNGTWYYHSINSMVNIDLGTGGIPAITSFWTDYPGLGLGEDAIYVTGNLFEIGGTTIGGTRLWIVDKGVGTGGFYENGPATVTIHDPMGDTNVDLTKGLGTAAASDFRSMQPAHMFGNPPGNVDTWLTLYDGNTNRATGAELVDVIRVDDPLGTPQFSLTTVDVGDIEDPVNVPWPIPEASQLGSAATIDGGDRRTLNAVWRDNSLYTSTVIYPLDGPDINQVTAHWFRFNTADLNNPTLADQGNVGGEELGFAVNTYWPAVNVDSQGNMAVGFAASGPTLYAGAYYAMRAADDDPGTLRDAVAIAPGLDVYDLGGGTNRWGDYTAVALDPTDEVTFWAYNEYALPAQGTTGRWGTRWGSFRMGTPPAPPAPGPTTISGIKWHDLDDDGQMDPNEPPLPGIVIHLDTDGDGQFDFNEPTARTDAAGRYTITTTNTGTLRIRESIPPGWQQTYPGPNATVPFSHELTVSATGGEVFTDINFGNSDNAGFDHGDAPAPYPTLEANNGAKHPVIPGFGLGLLIDAEGDGIPDVDALGDDNSNTDDEDGVILPTDLIRGTAYTPTVTVSLGGQAAGQLQAWIDFNRDGDWDDAGEQIYKNVKLGQGTAPLPTPFVVPLGAVPGTTYARFRYGYESDLGPAGLAPKGGEVEDYVVNILSDRPVANADQFTVDRNSVDNVLDVMANDTAGQSGRQSLQLLSLDTTTDQTSGTVSIDTNGTPDLTDDVVKYTPRTGALGTDSFRYTIKDIGTGFTDTAQVTVTIVQPPSTVPIAVDDSYFNVTSVMTLPVMTNDVTGPNGPISIDSLDLTGTNGSVSHNGQVVTYTPPLNFTGPDQFKYTIKDTNNATSQATVTVHVPDDRGDDLVQFELVVTDVGGGALPDGGDGIPNVNVGDRFEVHVYVDDTRNNGAPYPSLTPPLTAVDQGVGSAYMDLLYDTALVSYNGDPTGSDWSPDYPSSQFVDSSVPGMLNELGAFQGQNATPLGPLKQELVKLTFTASATGVASFRPDPVEDLPLHETAIWHHPDHPSPDPPGFDAGVVDYPQIEFLQATVQIGTAGGGEGEGGFTNPNNAMDVNNDGYASPIDALLLISYLNANGSTDVRALSGEGEGAAQTSASRYYYDVNADRVISPLDVLGVVGFLNSMAVQSGGEGEASSGSAVRAAEAVAPESADLALGFELTTLQTTEPRLQTPTDPERSAAAVSTDEGDAATKSSAVWPAEELPGQTEGLDQILTDDLAEDILGGWSNLPSDEGIMAELV